MGEFGNKFRKEREKQGISLEDVSNVTKISSRMLRAIEDEQFDRLPGGVFNKGFIRAYAKHLGLNDDQAVTDYLACLRQSQLDAQDVWDPQARAATPERRQPGASDRRQMNSPPEAEELPELQLPRAEHVAPPRRDYAEPRDLGIPWRILAVAVLVVVLAVLLWHRHSRSPHTPMAATPPVTSTAQTPPQPANTAAQTSTATTSPAPAPARPSTPKPVSSLSAAATVRPLNPAVVKPAVTAGTDSNNQENGVLATQPDETATPPAEAQAPGASASPLNLVIRASENSWISVSADGQAVLHETLIAPAHTSIHAAREIVLRIGNAAGVTFLWNGHELPAQGAEAEVKTLVFDASGMRVVPPAPAPAQNRE